MARPLLPLLAPLLLLLLGCPAEPDPTPVAEDHEARHDQGCRNGTDDDGDTLIDCDDVDCTGAADCDPPDPAPHEAMLGCSDGDDGDGDGLTDCDDPDCEATLDCNPVLPTEERHCADALDDDGDAAVDCDDSDCAGDPECNEPPSGHTVHIPSPGGPDAPIPPNFPLSCRLIGLAEDLDGDEVFYSFAWDVDGTPMPELALEVPTELLELDQVWTCTVTPTDQIELGEPASKSVVIGYNAPPTVPGVAVTPIEPTSDDDLECTITTPSVDPDGGFITYDFSWSTDGAPAGLNTSIVTADQTSVGQEWLCEVRAWDGSVFGDPGSAAVTIQ